MTSVGMKEEQMLVLGNAIVELLRLRHDSYALATRPVAVDGLLAVFPCLPREFLRIGLGP